MALPLMAIALGDPAGIGPEVALKAALDPRTRGLSVPLLVGDARVARAHAAACGITAPIIVVAAPEAAREVPAGAIALRHLDLIDTLAMGTIAPAHGRAAVLAAGEAIRFAMAGAVDAVIACPQTEIAIREAGIVFDGYPGFVARETGTPVDDVFLMLCFDDKRIVHTTLHVSLRRAIELITQERVERALSATVSTLRRLGISAPRIAVAGLNPHAGEHGMFGEEDEAVIAPAMRRVTDATVEGPFGADTMFQKPGYDAFVVMVHDQGHIAAKLLATNRTAGLTIGTPILFSSVAHGSALDIAGRNKASAEAVVEAVQRLSGQAASVGAGAGARA